jgi:hypothetical protein
MNKWEQLCKGIESQNLDGLNESKFRQLFESYLETIFHWGKEDIETELTVPMGKTAKYADLVLKGNDFGIVIEFKAPRITLGEDNIRQLFSYMRILGHKFGFLIGNEIKAVYDDDGKRVETEFWDYERNNPAGIEFGEMMDKPVCSSGKLKEFVFSIFKASSSENNQKPGESDDDKKHRKIISFFREHDNPVKQQTAQDVIYFRSEEIRNKFFWIFTPKPRNDYDEFKWETNNKGAALLFDENFPKIEKWCRDSNKKMPIKRSGRENDAIRKIFIEVNRLNSLEDALEDALNILNGTRGLIGWDN